MKPVPPRVLVVAGHDPSGGAGVIADAQTLSALGCHPLSVITALTVQDSSNVAEVQAVPADLIERQLDRLLLDQTPGAGIAAIKIGLIGDVAQIAVILRLIRRCARPVVLDPVLRAGGGHDLAGSAVQRALIDQLLPEILISTPNAAEARRLAGCEDLASAADALLATGCRNLLITGGDEPTPDVVHNTWYTTGAAARRWEWPRIPHGFHGAGCTLASALAARLALGDALQDALENAQRWVQAALAQAYPVGRGRHIPGRL